MQTQQTMDWMVEFHVENAPSAVQRHIKSELVIGRPGADEPTFQGLDVGVFNGAELGVSRRHAVIRRQGANLVVYDLHSNNGTTLNGERLKPDEAYVLKDGDKLCFGDLKMSVRIHTDIGPSSIRGKRTELSLDHLPLIPPNQPVLVVEDDPLFQDLYQETLAGSGFHVQKCSEVVSAIRYLHHYRPAVILLDLNLPSITGLELCRYVRRDVDYPSIPIIVVSARSGAESVKQALDAGADIFLSKPVNLKELVGVINALASKNTATSSAPATKQLGDTASNEFLTAVSHDNMIVLFVEGHREPINEVVETSVTLGRRGDATLGQRIGNGSAIVPQLIDLQSYDAFEKGVSRAHAEIKHQDKKFVIQDMGSQNGTFVNRKRLPPHEFHPLKNGDEVWLGQLRITFYSLSEEAVTDEKKTV